MARQRQVILSPLARALCVVIMAVGWGFLPIAALAWLMAHATVNPPWAERFTNFMVKVGVVWFALAFGIAGYMIALRVAAKRRGTWPPSSDNRLLNSEASTPQPSGSRLAIVSFILGLAAFCSLGLSSLPALILGVLALKKIWKSNGYPRDEAFALGGIILAILGACASSIMLFVGPD